MVDWGINMSHVIIKKLDKSFGTNKILNQFSLEIKKGEFISLLGPSGSGKTTVLRCIAGLETPDSQSGEIVINNAVVWASDRTVPPEKRNLGMVFQNYAVWPHMNIFENVAFPLKTRRATAGEVQTKVNEVLNMVRLAGLEKRFPHELSGGQQQRIALARALVMSPEVLLLDEPLSNLDALLREELGAEIRKLQKNFNLTTILVTHDRKEALSLSDRIVLLNNGRIEVDGTPEDLYNRPPTPFTALFLAGAQKMTDHNTDHIFLPRLWRINSDVSGKDTAAYINTDKENSAFKIVARLYLGSEYEYWAENKKWPDPIRFFSAERHEIGASIILRYEQ